MQKLFETYYYFLSILTRLNTDRLTVTRVPMKGLLSLCRCMRLMLQFLLYFI